MKMSVGKKREWVHIQCVLWIPEVTLRDPDKMAEPDISNIPDTRLSLRCYICQAGIGCVQVSLIF